MRRLSVTTAGLALAIGALAACNGDSGDATGVAGRTPCGAHGRWDDGATETERYARDERGRLIEAETRDSAGAIVRHRSWDWDGKLLRAAEIFEGGTKTRLEYDYEFDRLLRITRTDDAGAVVTTYGYAGDAMVTQDVEAKLATQDHRHATITGDLTDRTTIVDCAVTAPERCQTWVFEQPDRIAEHWTRATVDLTSDGTIELRYERTLDSHGLEATFVESAIGGGGIATVLARETTTRDADGAELGFVREMFELGAPRGYDLDDDYTCPSAKPRKVEDPDAATGLRHPGRTRLDLDETSLGPRRLRRDLVATTAP